MGERKVKVAAFSALGLAVAAVLAVVVLGGSSHQLNLRFIDAGQLVKGDLVEIAGRPVGSVGSITLTDNNQANVQVSINDSAWPLHEGTVAGIRAVGLSGIANRYVELTPGPSSAPSYADDGVVPTTKTRPIVDLDQVLTALNPPTRAKLQRLIHNGSTIFDGTADDANKAITYLNPAVAQSHAVLEELDQDTAAVGRLVTSGAAISTTLANRNADVQGSISSTARVLEAIASENSALGDTLSRAPSTLAQAQRTLRDTSTTLTDLRPVIRELRPAAAPLASVLRRLPTVSRNARPAVGQLRRLLPALRKALLAIPALDKVARPALASTTSSVSGALDIFAGLRPYTPDIVLGLSNGFTGTTAGYYDANGHYARVPPITTAAAASGLFAGFGTTGGNLQAGKTARCPGGAVEPADDKSNPYVPDPSLCDPSQDQK